MSIYGNKGVKMTGWRYGALVGGLVGLIGLTLYPVIIDPYLHPEKWQNYQKYSRAGMDREKIQPGGMKIWTDPFDRKEE